MNDFVENVPFLALIDDDSHSAHLLTRMLLAHGSPDVTTYASAEVGSAALNAVLSDPTANWPSLVIVDLKAHSSANLDFITAHHAMWRPKGVPIVVMSAPLDRQARETLERAGASAVFFRHAELDAYRREVAGIVSYWARTQRLDAVGM